MDLLLNNGMLAQIDAIDADVATHAWRAWYKKGWQAGWIVVRDHGRKGARKRVYLHRLIALRFYFNRPERMCVRPLDGNHLNCQRSNLYVYEKGYWRPNWYRDGANEPNPYERYSLAAVGDAWGDQIAVNASKGMGDPEC